MSVHVCICIFMNTYILCMLPKGPRNNDTPESISKPIVKTLGSKHHSPIKGIRNPWGKRLIPDQLG